MIEAEYRTGFSALVPGAIPDNSKGDEKGIYTNWAVVKQFRARLRDQNDDLGTEWPGAIRRPPSRAGR